MSERVGLNEILLDTGWGAVVRLVVDGGLDPMGIIEARGLARTFKSRKRTVEAVRVWT